ncbi:PREDICTED: uncharacterized protein LOC106111100 [Papilio polytes]|uniref:uncharacterized protein LOC106111100 n=1 Tax=Papilio polytes TaxID=76194 RepID=UPI000676095E|nr:PREDICTED: uncharacterized protein LOC106111100 [Papilio polytes]
MNTSIFLVSFVIVTAHCNKDLRVIDNIMQESPCSSKGGICTIAEDCPQGKLTDESGLCPKQRNQGIECCYGLSVKDTRCSRHGGVCLPATEFCNPKLIYREASDCDSSHKCCIMV